MNPVIARLVLTGIASVASYFGLEVAVSDGAVQALGALSTAAFALWATLGLRRPDKGAK